MPQLKKSELLFMQFHTAKLFLYQVAYFERNLQQSAALHLNILCEGLESAKSFLDLYLWLPPKSEMALTNAEWVQLSFGVTQAAKFAIISKAPNVEPQTRELRQRLNIDHVFRHLTLRIGALVGRAGERDKHKDIFHYYETRVRKIQTWYEKMSRAVSAASPGAQQTPLKASASASPATHTPSSYSSNTPPLHQQYQQGPESNLLLNQQPQSSAWTMPQHAMAQDPSATLGMASMGPYGSYDSIPPMTLPDLMSAPGWEALFAVPMEDVSWFVDMNQGMSGSEAASTRSSESVWQNPRNM